MFGRTPPPAPPPELFLYPTSGVSRLAPACFLSVLLLPSASPTAVPSGFAPDTLCALRYATLVCAAILEESQERTVWTFPLFF